MACLLKKAEQQGLIDVFSVKVFHHEWLSFPQNRPGYPKYDRESDTTVDCSETKVNDWMRLDGSKPGYVEETLNTDKGDCILQVSLHVQLCFFDCSAPNCSSVAFSAAGHPL